MGRGCGGVRDDDQQKAVKELLGTPEQMELITLRPVGYQADTPKPPGTPRKAMNEIIHWERFGETAQAR